MWGTGGNCLALINCSDDGNVLSHFLHWFPGGVVSMEHTPFQEPGGVVSVEHTPFQEPGGVECEMSCPKLIS